MLNNILSQIRHKSRENRGKVFRKLFSVNEDTRVLDLGSGDGDHISQILDGLEIASKNVFIADINANLVLQGANKFGFTPIVLEEGNQLPFTDKFFDIVFCSSVIEHVTVPKSEIWKNNTKFRSESRYRQKEFAEEIKRVGKRYFVQTPNKWFPFETHTWLPLVNFLPHNLIIPLIRFTNHFWVKKTTPDWSLLTLWELKLLFSEAIIIHEKVFIFTKSLIAIKN